MASVLISKQGCQHRECTAASLLYIIVMGTKSDVLLLLGMLMLGMALGALLTLIRQKAITAKVIRELEARFGIERERLTSAERMIRRSRMQHNAIADVPQIAESLYTSPKSPV